MSHYDDPTGGYRPRAAPLGPPAAPVPPRPAPAPSPGLYGPPPRPPAPAGPARNRYVLIAVLAACIPAALGVGVLVGLAAAGQPRPAAAPQARVSTVYYPSPVEVQAPPAAATTTKAAAPSHTIEDGTWTVGQDFPAGKYTTTDATSDCYWGIYKSGTNGGDIIDNHIGGGHLTLTLKVGQDFETNGCGTWRKVG